MSAGRGATPSRILMVLTSHGEIGSPDHPTGLWLEEFAAPYYAFLDAGAAVTVSSIRGGRVPVDPKSVPAPGEAEGSVGRFLADPAAGALLTDSAAIDTLEAGRFDAVFLPGGHGTMWDLPDNAALARHLADVWARGGVVAAVCHGPAGLLGALDEAGRPIVEGRRVNAFTDVEEDAAGLSDAVPFLLETRLRALGCRFESGPAFEPYAVRDGQLVTGQNPMSSDRTAALVLEALAAR